MCFGKAKHGGLCPFSFGLALGITYGLAAFLMVVAIMYGVAPIDPAMVKEPLTWSVACMQFLWGFVEGFVFGFILILLYDCIASCMAKCCKKSDQAECSKCGCNCDGKCGCGSKNIKP